MALKKTVDSKFGIEIVNAYHKVDNVILNTKETITFDVVSYAETKSGEVERNQHICHYDLNGENPFKQAYAHLKTLSEFTDAIDC